MEFFPGMAVPVQPEGRAARLGACPCCAALRRGRHRRARRPACAGSGCAERPGGTVLTDVAARGSPAPRWRWLRWKAICSRCTRTWPRSLPALLIVACGRAACAASAGCPRRTRCTVCSRCSRWCCWLPRPCTRREPFTAEYALRWLPFLRDHGGARRRRRARGADPRAARGGGRRGGRWRRSGRCTAWSRRGVASDRAAGGPQRPRATSWWSALPLLVALRLAKAADRAAGRWARCRGGSGGDVLPRRRARARLRGRHGWSCAARCRSARWRRHSAGSRSSRSARRCSPGQALDRALAGEDLHRRDQCGHPRAALAGGRTDAGRQPGARGRAGRVPQRVRGGRRTTRRSTSRPRWRTTCTWRSPRSSGLPAFALLHRADRASAFVATERVLRVRRDRRRCVAVQAVADRRAVASTFLSEQYYLPIWSLVAVAIAADLRS